MHSEYLRHARGVGIPRHFFLNNDLAEGRYEVSGHPISLRDIHIPIFTVSTITDHVAPWRSVYKIQMLTHADVTFVLSNGGHNAGVVNPPAFRIGTTRLRPIRKPRHTLIQMPGKKLRPITKDRGGRVGGIGSSGSRQSKLRRHRWTPDVKPLAMPQERMSSIMMVIVGKDEHPREGGNTCRKETMDEG